MFFNRLKSDFKIYHQTLIAFLIVCFLSFQYPFFAEWMIAIDFDAHCSRDI